MKELTGFQYLAIDIANNYDGGLNLDKEVFDTRIQWVLDNIDQLEALAEGKQWKERPLYLKAVMALRDVQQGKPTGHLVGFDSVNSGMQIMSALTGCVSGATATGLVDLDRRADAYTDCTRLMGQRLGSTVNVSRKDVKAATMTALYGSKAEPKQLFGEDTPELAAFYEALYELAPGACQLLSALVGSWNPDADIHEWILPDGFHARVKVIVKREERITVEELGNSSFTFQFFEQGTMEKAVKNVANAIHSIDAYVLRSLLRRCSYDPVVVNVADALLCASLLGGGSQQECDEDHPAYGHIVRYGYTQLADITILQYLDEESVECLSEAHKQALRGIIETMLVHTPFSVLTIHDD